MAISNSVASGISAGSNALTQGLGIGVQKSALESKENQQKMLNFNQQYSSNMKQAVDNLATVKKQLDDQATYQKQQIKNTIVPEKQSEAIASIEANYQKQLTDLQNHAGELFKQQFAPLAQMGSQLGYMNPAQIGVDEATFKTAVSGLRPEQQAVVEATKQGAQEAAKAQATNESVTYYNPNTKEAVAVLKTDTDAINKLQRAGAYPVPMSVQATSVGELTKPAQTKAQETLMQTGDILYQLNTLKKDIKPDFFSIPNRAYLEAADYATKWGKELSPEQQKKVEEYRSYQTRALGFINNLIHALTGAQLSQFEAVRIRKSAADLGENITSGNSYTTFNSKLDTLITDYQAQKTRYQELLQKGVLQPGQQITQQIADAHPLSNYTKKPKETPTTESTNATPTPISTKSQFDSLPSGATYINSNDGKTYRKP